MPRRHTNNDEDVLITNEQLPARDDDDAGGFIGDQDEHNDANLPYGLVQHRFVPASLPYNEIEEDAAIYANVDLQTHQMLITDAPPDKWNYTYLVFYLLGIGTMTPWNFFVTAENYWNYKFRNVTLNDTDPLADVVLTPLQKSFTCDLTLTAAISGTTFLILNAVYGRYVSLRLKMVGTMTIILLLFGVTTAFVEINTDSWQDQFFLITLFTVVLLNISSATMSGAVFGFTGLFPAKYMTAVVSGQALGGIFTAVAIILVLMLNISPQSTAFIYFIIGSILILLSIICYEIMARMPFFKYYLDGGDKYKIICETPSHSRIEETGVPLEPILSEVFGKIYLIAICTCLLFATTLSVYPGVTVLMQSQNFGSGNAWSDIYYLPVVNYLIFNCGDYFGRLLAGWIQLPQNPHTVLLFAFMRIIFIPFFLCSNSDAHVYLPVLVHTDVTFISMMSVFALSNGYFANILLMMAPSCVKQHEKELASSIMAACLSLGLALGAMLSMILVQML